MQVNEISHYKKVALSLALDVQNQRQNQGDWETYAMLQDTSH